MEKFFSKKPTQKELMTAGAITAVGIAALVMGKNYFNGGVCKLAKDLTGKVVIITGANIGIGKETALELARLNATVILACRDSQKTFPVIAEIKTQTHNQNVEFIPLDLSDMASIRAFVQSFKSKYNRLDILINNAAVMALPERILTKDGFETQFATNYIGPFYLTNLLVDLIKASAPSRIINLSSDAHTASKTFEFDNLNSVNKYHPLLAYVQSKLAFVMFTKELQRRLDLEGAQVKVVSLHPGVVRTEAMRHLNSFGWKAFFALFSPIFYFTSKSSKQGAQTTLYLAQEEHTLLKAGAYYVDCKVNNGKENPFASNSEAAARLWTETQKLLADQPSQ